MGNKTAISSARWGLLVLLLALAIRLAFALSMDQVAPRNDERAYMEIANGILQRGEYNSLFRPPGLPAFEALVVRLGGNLETIRVAQAFLSTISIGLLAWLAWRRYGGRAGFVALCLSAVDPVSIGFSHLLWTETLFLFALTIFLVLWSLALESGRWWMHLIAGLSLGLCGLVRPVVLTAAPLFCLWLLLRDRARWRAALPVIVLLAAGALAAVLPWSLRNLRATGSFVLVDTNGAYNFLIGSEPDAMFRDKDDCWSSEWAQLDGQPYGLVAERDPGYAQARALQVGLRNLRGDFGRYLGAIWFEGTHLWSLDSFPLRHLRNDWYGPEVDGWVLPALTLFSIVLGIPLLAGGFAGWLAASPSSLRSLLWILIAHSALLHAALFSLSRFQMPLRALLALGAGILLTMPRDALRDRFWQGGRPTRRGWLLVAILFCLLWAWGRDVPLLTDMLLDGGADHRFQRLGAR